jgi:hypothetical protein
MAVRVPTMYGVHDTLRYEYVPAEWVPDFSRSQPRRLFRILAACTGRSQRRSGRESTTAGDPNKPLTPWPHSDSVNDGSLTSNLSIQEQLLPWQLERVTQLNGYP